MEDTKTAGKIVRSFLNSPEKISWFRYISDDARKKDKKERIGKFRVAVFWAGYYNESCKYRLKK